jgi:hypothetical protein
MHMDCHMTDWKVRLDAHVPRVRLDASRFMINHNLNRNLEPGIKSYWLGGFDLMPMFPGFKVYGYGFWVQEHRATVTHSEPKP